MMAISEITLRSIHRYRPDGDSQNGQGGDSNETPLYVAVVNGWHECVRALLQAGANPDAVDNMVRCRNKKAGSHHHGHPPHVRCLSGEPDGGCTMPPMRRRGCPPALHFRGFKKVCCC